MYEQKNESGACNGGWFLICSIAPFMTAREFGRQSFLKGCNMRCQWCHNPETISFERGNAVLSGKVHRLRYVR